MTKQETNTNPFKELVEEHTPSDNLKDRVISSTRLIDLLLSTFDLFSVKAAKTAGSLFRTNNDN